MKSVNSVNSLLKGFIKIVHPDLFANATKPIQAANLNCVKSLNEVLDFADKIEHSLSNKRLFDINSPLSTEYNIPCYANNPDMGGRSEDPYIKTKFQLYTPINFTTKQTFTNSHELESSTKELYSRLIDSFYYAGLQEHRLICENPHYRQSMAERVYLLQNNLVETPQQEQDKLQQRRRSGFGVGGRRSEEGGLSKADEAKFYEQSYSRWVTLEVQAQTRRRAARLHAVSRRRQRAICGADDDMEGDESCFPGSFLSTKSSRQQKRGGKRGASGAGGNSNYRGYNALSEDVDVYIANGNVLVNTSGDSGDISGPLVEGRQLAAQDKLLAPLRQFILEYGDVIHFNMVDYKPVIMCLHQSQTANQGRSQGQGQGADADAAAGAAHKAAPSAFTLTQHGQHYIIDIPCPFKPKQLLRFIQDELPVANILFQAGAVAPEGFDLGAPSRH